MHPHLKTAWQWLTLDLRRLAVLISMLLSTWIILTNDTINVDGILYLDAAHQMLLGNWSEAYALYHWPFYPALIALTSKLTFLGLEPAALLLNYLFFAIIAWLFLTILSEMGASRQVLIAGLIIISAHPYLNEYRADVARGAGFWSCFLWATLLLIRLQDTAKFKYGLWLGLALTLCMLFRIEGAAFLTLAPLILILQRHHVLGTRLKLMASSYLAPLLGAGLLGVMFWIKGGSLPSGRLLEPLKYLQRIGETFSQTIPAKGEIIATQVLNQFSDDYGTIGVYAILASILIVSVTKRATLLFLILATYAIIRARLRHSPLLLWLICINLAYLTVYVMQQFFLSSRFAMPLALIIALPASYGLAALFQNKAQTNKAFRVAVALLLLLMLVDGLFSFGHSKRYLREAGQWIAAQYPEKDRLLTNNLVIRHYAQKYENRNQRNIALAFSRNLGQGVVSNDLLTGYGIIAIRTKHVTEETLKRFERLLGTGPEKAFTNGRGTSVLIYRNTR